VRFTPGLDGVKQSFERVRPYQELLASVVFATESSKLFKEGLEEGLSPHRVLLVSVRLTLAMAFSRSTSCHLSASRVFLASYRYG
jgi:hypothetical protein